MLQPLSPYSKIPVAVQLFIDAEAKLSMDRHYHIFLPRHSYTCNLDSILRLIQDDSIYSIHNPFPTLNLNPPTFTTHKLTPSPPLLNIDPELHEKDNGNRAMDSTSYYIKGLFNDDRHDFSKKFNLNLPHEFILLSTGDYPEEQDSIWPRCSYPYS